MKTTAARISVTNGNTYCTPREAIEAVGMETIAMMMDDEIRELVARAFTPESDVEFINLYLALADEDLIIG